MLTNKIVEMFPHTCTIYHKHGDDEYKRQVFGGRILVWTAAAKIKRKRLRGDDQHNGRYTKRDSRHGRDRRRRLRRKRYRSRDNEHARVGAIRNNYN